MQSQINNVTNSTKIVHGQLFGMVKKMGRVHPLITYRVQRLELPPGYFLGPVPRIGLTLFVQVQ